MLQNDFNDFQNIITQESVKLTADLLNDIENGTRLPLLNEVQVPLREKLIASVLMDRYAEIIQSYVLVDLSDLSTNYVLVENLMSRQYMQDLVLGVNRFTGVGLNESEDFILDRELITPLTTVRESFVGTTGQVLIITTEIFRGNDMLFVGSKYINNINRYYSGIGTNRVLLSIPLTSGQLVDVVHSNNAKKAEYLSEREQEFFSLPFVLRSTSLVFRNGDYLHDGYSGVGSNILSFTAPLELGEKIAALDSNDYVVDRFIGNGVQTNFPLSVLLSDQSLVFLNEELQDSGYVGFGTSTIVFIPAPANGTKVAVIKVIP
jgi:hypothetical protein